MSICAEYLHCFHWEFAKQPSLEKAKWFAFVESRSNQYEKEQKIRESEARAQRAEAKAKQHRYR